MCTRFDKKADRHMGMDQDMYTPVMSYKFFRAGTTVCLCFASHNVALIPVGTSGRIIICIAIIVPTSWQGAGWVLLMGCRRQMLSLGGIARGEESADHTLFSHWMMKITQWNGKSNCRRTLPCEKWCIFPYASACTFSPHTLCSTPRGKGHHHLQPLLSP